MRGGWCLKGLGLVGLVVRFGFPPSWRFSLIRHECADPTSDDCVGAEFERVLGDVWRLVMVPEARRGERGLRTSRIGPGATARGVRARAQIPTSLLREVYPASLAERAFGEKTSLAERA